MDASKIFSRMEPCNVSGFTSVLLLADILPLILVPLDRRSRVGSLRFSSSHHRFHRYRCAADDHIRSEETMKVVLISFSSRLPLQVMAANGLDTALYRACAQAITNRAGRNDLIAKLAPDVPPVADLFSNDYLSLATNAELRADFLKKLTEQDAIMGSTGSRLLAGNTSVHLALEEQLAAFFRAPTALLFNSGFVANSSVMSTLPLAGDVIVFDELVHASCRDGMATSRAAAIPGALVQFKHNDVDALRQVLMQVMEKNPRVAEGKATVFVVVEALYSMDGDTAPLVEMVNVVKDIIPAEARHFIVDEAHSTGIYGSSGRGLVAQFGLEAEIHTRVHTFGKAMASAGAIVLTAPIVRAYLINYARGFAYTTSLPIHNVLALRCAFDMLEREGDELIAKLHHHCEYFSTALEKRLKPIPPQIMHLVPPGPKSLISPIFPIIVPKESIPLANFLTSKGYNAKAVPYPIVPRGLERIRVCLHSGNTEAELDKFLDCVVEWAAIEEEKLVCA
ncbi:PLP-dependent transferase [Mycena chlorophos]|uniref:PLP-dependent transferase n=1 Tax=Mycena chlorophos TaxID=658473 RepID=A0A8H6THS4_MYCCL|nr:PLP-dependent transferase [Mycena chlorophos]